jgi:hypothetical protein
MARRSLVFIELGKRQPTGDMHLARCGGAKLGGLDGSTERILRRFKKIFSNLYAK